MNIEQVESLYRTHGARVRRLLSHLLGSVDQANDATQETFLRLTTTSHFDPNQGDAKVFLFGIARNVAREMFRTKQFDSLDEPALIDLGVAAGWGKTLPDAQLAQAEQREQLIVALASLPPSYREILVLHDIEEMSAVQIAQLINEGLPAVKSRIHRARLSLLAELNRIEAGLSANERTVGGLSCGEVLSLLSSFVDNELGVTDQTRIKSHLLGCTVCEQFGSQFTHTVKAVRQHLGGSPAINQEIIDELRERLTPHLAIIESCPFRLKGMLQFSLACSTKSPSLPFSQPNQNCR